MNSTLKENERFEINGLYYFTCQFVNEFPVLILLDTDFSAISGTAEKSRKKSSDTTPLGTVISSYLTLEEFEKVTENNKNSGSGLWNSEYSNWSPCDGRQIPQSELSKLTNLVRTPDLRGVFLRGYNKFDPQENAKGIPTIR